MILVPLALAAALAVPPGCSVSGATLDWGFKESFRSYISSSIANGEWATSDGATYETPEFTWREGTGHYDPASGVGSVQFTGSVRFTGHDGLLDTTVADPELIIRDGSGTLVLDVAGVTMDGDLVETRTEFVDLGEFVMDNGTSSTAIDAETVLTEEGAVAFPNYAAGEAFDPVSLVMPLEDCVTYEGGYEPLDDVQTPWLVGGILVIAVPVLLVLGLVVLAVVLVRRRRRA